MIKQLILKILCIILLLCGNTICGYGEIQSSNQELSFMIKGRNVNLSFNSPARFEVSTGNEEFVIEKITDYVYIGGVMVSFVLTLDDYSTASKVIIKTTRGFESEHSIINGYADVQTFVPVPSISGQQIYIMVE